MLGNEGVASLPFQSFTNGMLDCQFSRDHTVVEFTTTSCNQCPSPLQLWVRTFPVQSWSWSYGSWIYNYLCNQCLKLWVRNPFMARCNWYNIMWSSSSVTCDRPMIFYRILYQSCFVQPILGFLCKTFDVCFYSEIACNNVFNDLFLKIS